MQCKYSDRIIKTNKRFIHLVIFYSILYFRSYLPELHDQVHEGGCGGVGLLGRSHGGLKQILNRDLVSKSLVEQPLPGCQLAVGQDLDLQRKRTASVHKTELIKLPP